DPKHPGVANRFVLVRNADASTGNVSYGYAMQAKTQDLPDFVDIVNGAFRGEQATGGAGVMHYDGARADALGIADDPTVQAAQLQYQFAPNGVQMSLQRVAIDPGTGTPNAASYQAGIGGDGSGQVAFDQQGIVPINATPQPMNQ